MNHALIPHPDLPARAVEKVDVELSPIHGGALSLLYRVHGAAPVLPDPTAPARADGLWKTTCFELFLRRGDDAGYFELNFSPSSQWAAYAFDSHRDGMRNVPIEREPVIEAVAGLENGVAYRVEVGLSEVAGSPLRANLTAVIEEADGTKSYWALAHPAGKPDFHDPACFVLELPAAKAA